MVHAYDHLRFKVDRTNLRHAACTEVRLYAAFEVVIAADADIRIDSSVDVKRRVQIREGVFHQRAMESHPAVSRMHQEKSRLIRGKPSRMQG